MSSAAGGYGGGAGSGAEPHCHGHGDFLLHHHHAQHVAAAQQLYHVPQHSRREKLRFPQDDGSPPHVPAPAPHQHWPPPPPGFYSYASSSTSSYSPHSPTGLPHVAAHGHGPAPPLAAQIPTQNFALSLSSSSSNPPPLAPQQQQQQPRRPHPHGAPAGPFGPFTGYAAVLGRSRFGGGLGQQLAQDIRLGKTLGTDVQGAIGSHGGAGQQQCGQHKEQTHQHP